MISMSSVGKTKKCLRCGLRYPANELLCVHCDDLADKEVEELKKSHEKELQASQNLGVIFGIMVVAHLFTIFLWKIFK
ncbi:MAG: hypothetical protein GY714_13235 [Desulfobacterales bacterium]|nr:hypothetical protein [Desulfobacterales bacterium]